MWTKQLDTQSWLNSWPVPGPGSTVGVWEGWFEQQFPQLKQRMQETPQDRIHHAEGDVWTHTKMVVQALLDGPDYAKMSANERGVCFWAAVLHDMSKPDTTQMLTDGRVIAPGHSKRGMVDARISMWKQDAPFAWREQVCRLIEAHQVPFHAFSDRSGLGAEYLARKLSVDRSLKLLCALAKADIEGRVCADQQKALDDIELFAQTSKDLHCWDRPFVFPDGATRSMYVLGHGKRDPHTPVFTPDPFEVIVLSGLPATGKDTWCDKHAPGLEVLSYDDTRADLGLKHGQGTGTIVHAVYDRAKELLRAKTSFVWNATHLSQSMRDPALSLIRQYGGRPHVVYLEASHKEVLRRNHKRDSSLTNEKLLRMAHRWEVPASWEADKVSHHIAANPVARLGKNTK